MVKFFKLCAIAIILSVAVSCGNNAGSYNAGIYNAGSPATPEVSGSHSITISYIKNGSGEDHGEVTASKTTGIAPGEKIYLTITPDTNYQLDKLYCQYYDGGDIPKNIDVTDNSFVMPNKNVYIGASFKEQASTSTYTVGSSEIENGEISFYIGSNSPQNSLQASKGTTVSILVLPNGGFEVDTLTATSASGKNLTIYENTFAMPEEDVTVGATFKASASSYTVKSSETQNGNVLFSVGSRSPETSLSVAKGTTVAIKATPDSGYAFYSLTVKDASGKEIQVMQNTFAMPESDVTVTAVFKKIYTITINKPTNGNIGVETPRGRWTTNDGAQTVTALAGETIVYDAILESGSIYKLDTFTITGVDGIDASKQKNSFVMPQSDVTISATFKEKSKYYIGAKCNTGEKDEYGYDKYETTSPYGTLTCDKEYAREGEKVTVTVTPTTGGKDYVVEKLCLVYNWSTILIPIDKAGEQVTFTVPDADTAIEVRAKFAEKTYSIKLADNITGGSITGFNSSGNHLGQKIRLFVTPDDGYKLSNKSNISITGASVTLDDFYCFEMPKADITIKPTFTPGATGRSITINPSDHGSVSCAKTTGVMPGSTVALMATPASGYKLNSFTVTTNGSEVAVSDNTFIMPDSDVSVSAEFLNGEERDVYVWIKLDGTSKTIEERLRSKIAPGTVVTSDGLPAGYVISSVYVTEYVTEHPELWNQGKDIQLTSRTDTDYSFVMPDCKTHVEINVKAPVKPKPDTIGDIVLEDGTAVAYENRSKLSETQKWHSIAVIFYDGKASTDLGNCVLGVGLAEGIGNWCYDTEVASYVKIPEITANPIRWGEPVTRAEFGKEVPVFGYPKREREVTFTGAMDGQIRGTNNFSKVKNYLGNDCHPEKMEAFKYCEEYKDQDGSRLEWIEDKKYQTGWYLPTIAELTYLLEKVGWVNGCISDVYGKTIISAFGSEDYYWSSSAVSGNKLEAWLARSESLARNENSDPDVSLLSYYKGNFNHIRAIREF